ncbi:MAG: N-6 DNA methylase [Anaerolineae bacterium]|nr:N-6 DNA methylase [Anaerolineae bacterium]
MLDTETKRRIDNARNVLVGKVPDPKAQVEQITIALIYKFMDDMDQQSLNLGGEASFFTGEFAQYAWHRLMSPALGGHERLNLYMQALMRMDENPGLPALFRNIFRNAYLPYNAPDTLNLFVKEIDGFTYDHSERLGDAFEYLLMVLGSQGDAGQFRTPRHIIEFIVDCVNPTKDDRVLDPACGTAGFLISAYKHILAQHGEDNTLTGEEREALMRNFTGYDISPDMVRLALVNLYLHQFPDPRVFEYDTLSSEERWDEYAEVILANPPFMTPKGGIIPHNRFSIRANRSEVLFVDYIAEHLTPDGRAGIIVPEGIIFQSSNAYKNLRKMLVAEGYLYAVVSLPAGVFNPYAGVKTSVLLLDRRIAKHTDQVLFVKIENDGFDLGAQRSPIEKNDLPEALQLVQRFQQDPNADWQDGELAIAVKKEKIAEDGDYNLTGDRYRVSDLYTSVTWPLVELGEVCVLIGGGTPSKQKKDYWENGNIKWVASRHISTGGAISSYEYITEKALEESSANIVPTGGTILITRVSVGKFAYADDDYAINQDLTGLVPKSIDQLSPRYLRVIVPRVASFVEQSSNGIGVKGVTRKYLASLQIPLPPLAVQEEIVAEIESYQRVIDGARQVVAAYQPRIPLDPAWPMVELGEVCEVNRESQNPAEIFGDDEFVYIDISSVDNETGFVSLENKIKGTDAPSRARRVIQEGDVLLSTVRPNLKSFALLKTVPEKALASTGFAVLTPSDNILPQFLLTQILSDFMVNQMIARMGKGSYPSINQTDVKQLIFPLPPIETQRAIVARIEEEQALVDANRRLIDLFTAKIERKIAAVWGEPPMLKHSR